MHMLAILVVLNRWVRGTRGAHRRGGGLRGYVGARIPVPVPGNPGPRGFPEACFKGGVAARRAGTIRVTQYLGGVLQYPPLNVPQLLELLRRRPVPTFH